jgi:hypothetical protein
MHAMCLLLVAVIVGCGENPPQSAGESPPPVCAISPTVAASQFDAATAGVVRGRVLWDGPVPIVPAFEIASLVTESSKPQPRLMRDNPHAPVVDPATGGVAGAVVFLRGVDAQRARPWDHAKVEVEHRDRELHVVQGGLKSRVGFVRQGDAITAVSREPALNALRARGAAFFTLMLPDPDQPLDRLLGEKGQVELKSGAGYYWMRGTLFVDDHPYYARTDAQGGFELPQVPPGRYEIVCWMPNWNPAGKDRDPESSLIVRLVFHPPLELVQEVVVESNAEARAEFRVEASMFKN